MVSNKTVCWSALWEVLAQVLTFVWNWWRNVWEKLIEKCFFAKLMWKLFQRRKRVEVRLSAGWWIGRWPLEWSKIYLFIKYITRIRNSYSVTKIRVSPILTVILNTWSTENSENPENPEDPENLKNLENTEKLPQNWTQSRGLLSLISFPHGFACFLPPLLYTVLLHTGKKRVSTFWTSEQLYFLHFFSTALLCLIQYYTFMLDSVLY